VGEYEEIKTEESQARGRLMLMNSDDDGLMIIRICQPCFVGNSFHSIQTVSLLTAKSVCEESNPLMSYGKTLSYESLCKSSTYPGSDASCPDSEENPSLNV